MEYRRLASIVVTTVMALSLGTFSTRAENVYVESFTTTTFRDNGQTTALWDIATGELKLPPFVPTLVGSYSSFVQTRKMILLK